ncbi:MAG TPA: recombinase family protein [Ktedonobacterales bacterium]|jgi:DNA invertase Pin-like site-specific DNA recombinase
MSNDSLNSHLLDLANAEGAAIYCRTTNFSYQQQLAQCLNYAKQHELTVNSDHIYVEDDTVTSDQILQRPGFAAMQLSLMRGKFSELIVASTEVLFHDSSDLQSFTQQLAANGVKFYVIG